MQKTTFLVLLIISALASYGQNSKYNLGFESRSNANKLPDGWFQWGKYDLTADSIAHSGSLAGKIQSTSQENGFGSIAYSIPVQYTGDSITLEGYMKIKNVSEGFAGLLLRVDKDGAALAFDNMNQRRIKGSADWKKYTITLPYPEKADNIYVAGILVGQGEAWFDDFVVHIDGQDLQTLSTIPDQDYKVDQDGEFDEGSNVEIPELSQSLITSLDILGKVWGFLKYHHPAIGKGNYNWDYELFRLLPDYLPLKNQKERNDLLVNWIQSLGTIAPCSECRSVNEDTFIAPDMDWIYSQELSEQLRNILLNIYENRHQGKHYYIGTRPLGNPHFKNENSYSSFSFPDDGIRLLALYRYWNMIHYFFPYKYLTDVEWAEVLRNHIPAFVNATDELDYQKATVQLISDVQDTHANLWGGAFHFSEWKGKYYPPFHVRFIEDQLVVTDYYNPEYKGETSPEIGDVITRINGTKINEIIQQKEKLYPASNRPTMLRDLANDLLRSQSKQIEVTFTKDLKHEHTKNLSLHPRSKLDYYRNYPKDSRESFRMLEDNIGYITLQTIEKEDFSLIKEQLSNTKGIIIDIRNYPSESIFGLLESYFIASPVPFAKFTKVNINHPGEFTFTNAKEISGSAPAYEGKIVVLLNEFSQSHAEYTAMAFRAAPNTTIVGSTTAGADGNVSTIMLPGGLQTMISGIGVYYPDGGETQRIGIVPDVEVQPTIKGIKEGRDELIEKAKEIILAE